MGIFSDIGDWFSGSDTPQTSGTPDNWYSVDSVAETADDYSSLFELPGTNTDDTGFWNSVLDLGGTLVKAANTPLGTGIIGGLANGYQNYQESEDRKDYIAQAQKNTDIANARIDKHNLTINTPPPDDLYKTIKVLR